jgi:hypothetical protein
LKHDADLFFFPPNDVAGVPRMIACHNEIKGIRDPKWGNHRQARSGLGHIADSAADAAGTVELNNATFQYALAWGGSAFAHSCENGLDLFQKSEWAA